MSSLARAFFRHAFRPLIWLLYRMRPLGSENVPRSGGVLLLSNHVSYIDSFILYLTCPRPVRFVVLEDYTRVKGIAWFLRLFGAIPIRPEKAKEAIVRTAEALLDGDVVCLFPEGGLTRLGVTTEFKKGFELIVRKASCPVVPVYVDGLFESIFAFERDRYFRKRPRALACPLQIAFGPPIPPDRAGTEAVRLAVWEQSLVAFAARREFRRPLEVAAVQALKRAPFRPLFAEYGGTAPRRWSRTQTLGLALAIARRWMNDPTDRGDRIGLLLPPGPMASLIHLGIFLAGRVPVNLPFAIGQEETERLAKTIAPLGIRTVITSRAFMPHLIDFWEGEEGRFIDMKSVVAPTGSLLNLFERVRALLEPAGLTCWRLDLGRRDPDREAVGLVDRPGGEAVFFTARQLHRDVRRVYAANFARPGDRVFTEDSLATARGLVFGCWGPILERGRALSRILSRRDDGPLFESALLGEEANLVAGSFDFFSALPAPPPTPSLKWGIVFDPPGAAELCALEERLGLPLAPAWSFEGRVLAMSRTHPHIGDSVHHQGQRGRDPDSVGRLLPGLVGKVEEGRLWLRLEPDGEWRAGPRGAEIASDGLLYLGARG